MPTNKAHTLVRVIHGHGPFLQSKQATLHHRGSDSIMPCFAIDGFPEFLCLRP